MKDQVKRLCARFGWWRLVHYATLALIHEHLFASGKLAAARDWSHVFYPWADALRLSILRYHQFPFWNPWPDSGEPLFADPQAPVLVPDTFFILAFGTVVGFKLIIFFYELVGYEGTRFLTRDLFGKSRFVQAVSIIPAIFPPLALHFQEGHIVFVAFLVFPWLWALSLTWYQNNARAIGLGVVLAFFLVSYVHYTVIIAYTICAPLAVLAGLRAWRSRETWLRGVLALLIMLGLAWFRVATMVPFLHNFPRTDKSHYPIVFNVSGVLQALLQPAQDRTIATSIGGLFWWELDTYVGFVVIFLAYESLRTRKRIGFLLVGSALLCLTLAFNNGAAPYPSFYLHEIYPWNHMVVITRWRLFAGYFLLVAAVHGLVTLHQKRHTGWAVVLAALAVGDLGYNMWNGYRDSFTVVAPPEGDFSVPPTTVRDTDEATWVTERGNHVSMAAWSSLLGYGSHFTNRPHVGTPGYTGDFPGTEVLRWSPNRIVLRGHPGDSVTLNINPSNYWTMNGSRLFPTEKEFNIDGVFAVTVPPSGRMDLRARPPKMVKNLVLQGLFAALALAVYALLWRIARRREANAMSE